LEKLSDPNNVTMLATIAIAAFTGTLWWSTRSMQKATLTSIELARAEFTATHRAKIIVQSARLADQGDDDRPAQINLTIVNTGETDATITEYTVQPYIQVNDAAFTPYFDRGTPIIPEDMKISLGEPATVIALCEKVDWLRYDEFLSGNAKLFVLGQISYAASDGIRRNTGFCRVYSKETGDWHVVKDSTYEYAY